MSSVKSFIYLDEYKMYSISSQIFEGLTEYIVEYSSEGGEKKEDQKGPVGSGRILGDIISKETGIEERRFLHDYSYTLFEQKLISDKKVITIDRDNIGTKIDEISNYDFIKVSGKATFNDMKLMIQTIKNFNEFGKALTYITNQQTIQQQETEITRTPRQTKNRNQRSAAKQETVKTREIEKLARDNGLSLDPKFIDKLAFLLDYGYKDQFELQIPVDLENEKTDGRIIFSSVLRRDFLKDKEDILIKRYSRNSEKNFTLFGIITQSERELSVLKDNYEDRAEPLGLKQALMNMNENLSNIENMYIGRLANEVIVDPIALYREI